MAEEVFASYNASAADHPAARIEDCGPEVPITHESTYIITRHLAKMQNIASDCVNCPVHYMASSCFHNGKNQIVKWSAMEDLAMYWAVMT